MNYLLSVRAATIWLHMHRLSFTPKSWAGSLSFMSLVGAWPSPEVTSWSHHAYRLWGLLWSLSGLSWSVVGIAYNKPEISCHACFNFHLRFTLTVVLHCRSWLSSSTSSWICNLRQTHVLVEIYGEWPQNKQAAVKHTHTRTWCCLASVGWLIDLCIIECSNSSVL